MLPKTRIIIATIIALFFVGSLAAIEFAVPRIQSKARKELQTWGNHASVDVTFKDVKLLWNGIRIVQLKVTHQGDKLRSNVDVSFGLDWHFPFIKPTLVTLDRPRIKLKRSTQTVSSDPKQLIRSAKRPIAELCERYFTAGISVKISEANLQILGSHDESILEVREFSADISADDRTAQISTTDFIFKNSGILSELSGQILLQKQREFYPFLLQARDPGGEPWQLKGQISHDFDSIDIRHKRKGVPDAWQNLLNGVGNPQDLLVLLRIKIDGLMTREQMSYNVRVATSNLHIKHPSLGKFPLGPWPLSIHAQGLFTPESASLTVSQGRILLQSRTKEPPLSMSFEGHKKNLQASMKDDPFRIRFHAQGNSCQSVLDSMPANLMPMLDGLTLTGIFALDGELNLLSQEPILKFTPGLNRMTCRVLRSPEILTREWLFTPSTDIPQALRQNPALLAIKMGQPIPRRMIPDDFFKALVAAEDAKFWRHEGILVESLLAALERNVKAGYAVLGGSTITMQLAKNLYLDRDKVISRKLQEMALAWVLEQNLTKPEILELYANAVEFAPNTYGIGKGAGLYFNKAITEINTAEALYLASILPSPARNYSESFCNARLTRGLLKRMRSVAEGLSVLSRERDFRKVYQTDLEQFAFAPNLGSCDRLENNRFSEAKERTKNL